MTARAPRREMAGGWYAAGDVIAFFGLVGVLGPTMLSTRDPVLAWKVGMGTTVAKAGNFGAAERDVRA